MKSIHTHSLTKHQIPKLTHLITAIKVKFHTPVRSQARHGPNLWVPFPQSPKKSCISWEGQRRTKHPRGKNPKIVDKGPSLAASRWQSPLLQPTQPKKHDNSDKKPTRGARREGLAWLDFEHDRGAGFSLAEPLINQFAFSLSLLYFHFHFQRPVFLFNVQNLPCQRILTR